MFDNGTRAKAHNSSGRRTMTVFLVLALLLVLLPASQVMAQEPTTTQVVLQQGLDGYEGTTDTYLDLGNASTVWGAADRLRTKTTENADALLRFDVSAIPTGSTIQQATLRLYAFDNTANRPFDQPAARIQQPSITLRSYQVLKSWAEDSATWEAASAGNAWGLPGCQAAGDDYVAEYTDEIIGFGEIENWLDKASRTTKDRREVVETWAEFDVTEAVQQWIDNPDSNYGVVIKAYLHALTVSYSFWSSEGPLPWFRPQLVIDYQ